MAYVPDPVFRERDTLIQYAVGNEALDLSHAQVNLIGDLRLSAFPAHFSDNDKASWDFS